MSKRYQRLTASLIADIQADLATGLSYSLIAERRGVCKTSVHRVKKMPRGPRFFADFVFEATDDTPKRKTSGPKTVRLYVPPSFPPLPVVNNSGRSYGQFFPSKRGAA